MMGKYKGHTSKARTFAHTYMLTCVRVLYDDAVVVRDGCTTIQATDIGARVLRSGGNAVDAAVAVAAALCGECDAVRVSPFMDSYTFCESLWYPLSPFRAL